MKKPILIFILLMMFVWAQAQDLSSYKVAADYTLINTTLDKTGNNDTIELVNAPFVGMEGVFSNGVYLDCLIRTPQINELDLDNFAVQVDFKLTNTANEFKSIIIGGSFFRWMGGGFDYDQKLVFVYNGIQRKLDLTLDLDRWYRLTLMYNRADTLGRMFLDGDLVATQQFLLTSDPGDLDISNTHGGIGSTYLGLMRNLKIYSPLTTSIEEEPSSDLILFPNPTGNLLQVRDLEENYVIFGMDGKSLLWGEATEGLNNIDVSGLLPGMYFIVASQKGKILSGRFVKE